MRIVSALTALGVAAFSLPATAQDIVDSLNERAFVNVLQDFGYKAELEYLDDGEPVIRSATSGTDFSVYFYDCDRGTNCKSIQFFVAYDMPSGMTTEQVNNWNKNWRFGKVYLDEENDPFMEMDVNLAFGVTSKNLEDTVDWWEVVVKDFEEYIEW